MRCRQVEFLAGLIRVCRMIAGRLAIVILGASGDLARRKLIPALYRLHQKNALPADTIVVGSGRTPFTDESFRGRFEVSPDFASRLHYHQGIEGLCEFLKSRGRFDRVLFFLALPPAAYVETVDRLAACGFGEESSIVIEKPFGYDFETSRSLSAGLHRHFDERRIFRIDHYLAKEAVQNILVFRFANALFQPVWNSTFVESIQINALETIGVGDRGAYFDRAGIIRDMVQNHLMQLLCLLTMEAPVSLDAEDIRARKIDVLRSCTVLQCNRFQYDGFRAERGVSQDSAAETGAELRLQIDNVRWAGTPVYIRTAKKMDRAGTEIGVQFKRPPRVLFNAAGLLDPNRIIFTIQPAEGIIVDLTSRIPGSDGAVTGTKMNFCYRDAFDAEVPEAYQRLLLDAMRGDHSLFVSAEESELSWKVFDDVLDKGEVEVHPAGAMPRTRLGAEWIDFKQYASVCA
jgi:glucose-6-phosphate 1-dehydrogenase